MNKINNIVDTVRATTQKITSSTIYTTVDSTCVRFDKKQEELGAAAAVRVVAFLSNLFNK